MAKWEGHLSPPRSDLSAIALGLLSGEAEPCPAVVSFTGASAMTFKQ